MTRLTRRILPSLAVMVLLAAALLLANDAAGGSNRFGALYPWVLSASALALLVLIVFIVMRLLRLRSELRQRAPGARLTQRVLLMLILLAVPPVVVVYGFALNFLNATIDTWFNVRMERALDDALEIGRLYLDERLGAARQSSATLAQNLGDVADADLQARLDAAFDAQGATQLSVFGDNRAVLASASSDPHYASPAFPDSATLLQVKDNGHYARRGAIRRPARAQNRAALAACDARIGTVAAGAVFAAGPGAAVDHGRGAGKFRFSASELPARLTQADLYPGADLRAPALRPVRLARGIRRGASPDGADRAPGGGHASRRCRTLRHATAGGARRRARLSVEFVQSDAA